MKGQCAEQGKIFANHEHIKSSQDVMALKIQLENEKKKKRHEESDISPKRI